MLLGLTKGVDSRIRFLAFKCNIVIKTQAIWSLLIHQTMLKKTAALFELNPSLWVKLYSRIQKLITTPANFCVSKVVGLFKCSYDQFYHFVAISVL